MTETRESNSSIIQKVLCSALSTLCWAPCKPSGKKGKFRTFHSLLPVYSLSKNSIVSNDQSGCVFGRQIFVGHLNAFWQAAGVTDCLPLLPGCGVSGAVSTSWSKECRQERSCVVPEQCAPRTKCAICSSLGIFDLQNWRIHKQGSILGQKTFLAIPDPLYCSVIFLQILCCLGLPWRHIVKIITNYLLLFHFIIPIHIRSTHHRFSSFSQHHS